MTNNNNNNKNLSLEETPIITFLVMGSTHHWMRGHAFCLLKAAPAFHWPTRVDCNLGPHLPAQPAKCPLQHSHAECSDCCHEGISGDKTNGSKPHSTTTWHVVVYSCVETVIRIVIFEMIWWWVLQYITRVTLCWALQHWSVLPKTFTRKYFY